MKVRSATLRDTPHQVTLTACDDAGDVARLEGEFVTTTLFQARRREIGGGTREPQACAAFAMHIANTFEASGGEVLVWESQDQDRWCAALEVAGFHRARRKAFVTRDLTTALPAAIDGLRLRSLAEVGDDAFQRRMFEASEGDPYEARPGADRDLRREWAELLEQAGTRFDPRDWFVADDAEGPVGVLLPQADDAEAGTLYYVGVVPSRRGKGLGQRLHATGLSLLAERGLSKYLGSTDLRNAPMLRVFERNGCLFKGTQAFFVLAPCSSSRAGRTGA